MKKILKQLGLAETSTEVQAVEAIKELQNKLSHSEAKALSLADQTKEAESKVSNLNTELESAKQLVADKNVELENLGQKHEALVESHEQAAKVVEKIIASGGEAALIAKLGIAPSDEVIEEIKERGAAILKEQEIDVVYMASDGTAFFAENDANNYCLANGYKVIPVGNTKPE